MTNIIPNLPVNLTNGTLADATQVMADFLAIVNAVNSGAASAGANTDITSLTGLTTPLGIFYGGTGAATAANARANLQAAGSGANSDITALTGLTTPLPVSEGGTGGSIANATTANNIGAAELGANSSITSLTGLTTPIAVTEGGTGSATPAGAAVNLGVPSFFNNGAVKATLAYNSGITNSYNVASVSNPSTGVFVVNFITALVDPVVAIAYPQHSTVEEATTNFSLTENSVTVNTFSSGSPSNIPFQLVVV